MKDMVEAVQAEPGTTHYEWFIGDDQKTCHIYERYADSRAVLTHLESFGRFAERLLSAIEVNRVVLFGEASAEVRKGLAAFDPMHMVQIGGFSR